MREKEGKTVMTTNLVQQKLQYKPVEQKVQPVPSYMLDSEGQVFWLIVLLEQKPLPLNPPPLQDFKFTKKLTRERVREVLGRILEGFLTEQERDLLVYVVATQEEALAFKDVERGTFSPKYFNNYKIPVIEHILWV